MKCNHPNQGCHWIVRDLEYTTVFGLPMKTYEESMERLRGVQKKYPDRRFTNQHMKFALKGKDMATEDNNLDWQN